MGARTSGLKGRMQAGEMLAGTFVKTPDVSVIEVLAQSGLDFLCLDGEHAPFGRRELDQWAVGVVVPHVDSVAKAEAVAAAGHFGRGGRGYAGSTRWAGFATRAMGEVLAQDAETLVIAQIEEPEGVEAVEGIAAVPGIDALFAGPADLSVGYGESVVGTPALDAALSRIGAACAAHGKAYVSWVPDSVAAASWAKHGITVFLAASEHSWMRQGAAAAADGIHAIKR